VKNQLKAIITGVGGIISAGLGVLGSMSICFCTFSVFSMILAGMGITSFFLTKYNILFLGMGVGLISLSVFYFAKYGNKKTCKLHKRKHKRKK